MLAARIITPVGDFRLDTWFEVASPRVVGLFGPSGSGKTTVLRCIAGLHRAENAHIRLGTTFWQDSAQGLFVPAHERAVGYVPQEADLFPHLSVRDNLSFGYRRVPAAQRRLAWDDVVEWLGVGALLERSVPTLSGGERQRVAIARALLASPELLLMDEPLSALDEPARREVVGYLEALLRELDLPVVYVSHSLRAVARFADTLIYLVGGEVRAVGPVAGVLSQPEFALWQGDDAAVVADGEVFSHDDTFQLTTLDTPWGPLTLHRRSEAIGTPLRVQVRARDVSLGLAPQEQSSILNELQLTVLDLSEASESDVLVRLGGDRDQPTLLARVTRRSCAHLALEPGMTVYARVKSVAVID